MFLTTFVLTTQWSGVWRMGVNTPTSSFNQTPTGTTPTSQLSYLTPTGTTPTSAFKSLSTETPTSLGGGGGGGTAGGGGEEASLSSLSGGGGGGRGGGGRGGGASLSSLSVYLHSLQVPTSPSSEAQPSATAGTIFMCMMNTYSLSKYPVG